MHNSVKLLKITDFLTDKFYGVESYFNKFKKYISKWITNLKKFIRYVKHFIFEKSYNLLSCDFPVVI